MGNLKEIFFILTTNLQDSDYHISQNSEWVFWYILYTHTLIRKFYNVADLIN